MSSGENNDCSPSFAPPPPTKKSRGSESTPAAPLGSYREISVPNGTEGGTAEGIQAVDQDERPSQVLPPLGDGVPHPVQAQVKLLDHVSVAVTDMGRPGQEEVVGRLPHALKDGIRVEERRTGVMGGKTFILTIIIIKTHQKRRSSIDLHLFNNRNTLRA